MATIEIPDDVVEDIQRLQSGFSQENWPTSCDVLMPVVEAIWRLTPERRFNIANKPVRVEDHQQQPEATEDRPLIYPKELNADLVRILSTQEHTAAGIAAALRITGQDITATPDEEVAAVIHFMLLHYIANPKKWKDKVRNLFREASLAQVRRDQEQAGAQPKF